MLSLSERRATGLADRGRSHRAGTLPSVRLCREFILVAGLVAM